MTATAADDRDELLASLRPTPLVDVDFSRLPSTWKHPVETILADGYVPVKCLRCGQPGTVVEGSAHPDGTARVGHPFRQWPCRSTVEPLPTVGGA